MPSNVFASTRVPYSKGRSARTTSWRTGRTGISVPAFVATYGSEELQELEGGTVLLEAIEEQDDVSLTKLTGLTSRRWKRGSACTPRCTPPGSSQARLEALRG